MTVNSFDLLNKNLVIGVTKGAILLLGILTPTYCIEYVPLFPINQVGTVDKYAQEALLRRHDLLNLLPPPLEQTSPPSPLHPKP